MQSTNSANGSPYLAVCDNDPGSHKEVHKNWSEVGVQKCVYLEQMSK